jgi:hypothetical protein
MLRLVLAAEPVVGLTDDRWNVLVLVLALVLLSVGVVVGRNL